MQNPFRLISSKLLERLYPKTKPSLRGVILALYSSRLAKDLPNPDKCIETCTDPEEPEERIDGKVAIITGGAQGIGYDLAQTLLRNGIKGVTLADNDCQCGERSCFCLCEQFGEGCAMFCDCDVVKSENMDCVFNKTMNHFQRVDLVVNNAGILDDKKWEDEITINIGGCVIGSLLGLQYMSKSCQGNGGVVINVGNTAGVQPLHGCPVYTMTQSAIVGFTRALGCGRQYERTGVKVMGLCVGPTDTRMMKDLNSKAINEHFATELMEEMQGFQLQTKTFVSEAILTLLLQGDSGSVWVASNCKKLFQIGFAPSIEAMALSKGEKTQVSSTVKDVILKSCEAQDVREAKNVASFQYDSKAGKCPERQRSESYGPINLYGNNPLPQKLLPAHLSRSTDHEWPKVQTKIKPPQKTEPESTSQAKIQGLYPNSEYIPSSKQAGVNICKTVHLCDEIKHILSTTECEQPKVQCQENLQETQLNYPHPPPTYTDPPGSPCKPELNKDECKEASKSFGPKLLNPNPPCKPKNDPCKDVCQHFKVEQRKPCQQLKRDQCKPKDDPCKNKVSKRENVCSQISKNPCNEMKTPKPDPCPNINSLYKKRTETIDKPDAGKETPSIYKNVFNALTGQCGTNIRKIDETPMKICYKEGKRSTPILPEHLNRNTDSKWKMMKQTNSSAPTEGLAIPPRVKLNSQGTTIESAGKLKPTRKEVENSFKKANHFPHHLLRNRGIHERQQQGITTQAGQHNCAANKSSDQRAKDNIECEEHRPCNRDIKIKECDFQIKNRVGWVKEQKQTCVCAAEVDAPKRTRIKSKRKPRGHCVPSPEEYEQMCMASRVAWNRCPGFNVHLPQRPIAFSEGMRNAWARCNPSCLPGGTSLAGDGCYETTDSSDQLLEEEVSEGMTNAWERAIILPDCEQMPEQDQLGHESNMQSDCNENQKNAGALCHRDCGEIAQVFEKCSTLVESNEEQDEELEVMSSCCAKKCHQGAHNYSSELLEQEMSEGMKNAWKRAIILPDCEGDDATAYHEEVLQENTAECDDATSNIQNQEFDGTETAWAPCHRDCEEMEASASASCPNKEFHKSYAQLTEICNTPEEITTVSNLERCHHQDGEEVFQTCSNAALETTVCCPKKIPDRKEDILSAADDLQTCIKNLKELLAKK